MNVSRAANDIVGVRLKHADAALLAVLNVSCALLGREIPKKILASSFVMRANRAFLQIEFLELESYPWNAWRSYAEHDEGIISALHNLAFYGCRGDELAFACRRSHDERFRYWIFADAATMRAVAIEGAFVRSADFPFVTECV